ncbi:MAG: hypothetical protein CMH48_03985 [Muricauda sp.]|jgi:ABC-type phosphate transport system ATPase subunit|nr:hypothetical protein [Allomuricauda sp.]MBC29985.1 hypothetical protein [Allomuricauda sp.]|tara:strand:+ start:109749 stop:110363 length:615 start_codon:yes stop_codon:yes gene_type:complete
MCRATLSFSKMTALIGYPGAGKTVGLTYFRRMHDNVIYMVVRKSMSTKEFYLEMLNEVGFEGDAVDTSLYNIINLIVTKVKLQSGKLLLIIDEAGKFKPSQLEYIHELRDQTEENLGIILAGPEYFYDNLYKWKQKKVVGIPEVFRRIQTFETLRDSKASEMRAICREMGISDHLIINELVRGCENLAELMRRINDYLSNGSID